MGKTLIIAEKPSVMTDLAKALTKKLGKFEKVGSGRDIYFESEQAIITSAVGHLVELRMPMGPNGKKLPWNFSVLPAIPDRFELDPIEQTEARLKKVLKLAKHKSVDMIVNACDAGREGELIFRYIMEIGGIEKPVKRLWMQSMTAGAIADAWDNLRSNEQMKPLADAAKCRSESDWLVGLNATRALTCFNSRHGGFNITAAGRVQTPTLAILAAREEEIQAFKAEPYFEVHATMNVEAGDYLGKWIDIDFKKSEDKPHGRAERIWDEKEARAIVARCEGKMAEISEEKKSSTQISPQLYDLTTLQREAPFSASGTLQIAQALYEKHKVLTYPRTDSRYLPEDYFQTVKETLGEIASSDLDVAKYAKAVLSGKGDKEPGLHKSKRVFNSAKVSDHFAIIPTGKTAKLSDAEQKVYDMVVKRFIAVFYPQAEFEQTTRLSTVTTGVVKDVFKTEGRVLVVPGWLEVYGRKPGVAAGKDDLVAIAKGEKAKADPVILVNEMTKPPARFTESTLLSAMEGAGKLVNDEELREAMSERGLGTPATRAAIIEGLIRQKYLLREARDLHVSPSGLRLIQLVRSMEIEGLYSPMMTGDWEYKLRQMEQGALKRPDFMKEIIKYTNEIVVKARGLADDAKNQSFPDVEVEHPIYGGLVLKQTDATYESRDPELPIKIKKHIAGRLLTEDELKELMRKGIVGPLQGFKSKFNKPFDASLKMDEKFKTSFVFEGDDESSTVELTEEMLIGSAKVDAGKEYKVYATDKAYVLPDLVTKKDPNGVRIGKVILQREIPHEQVLKMLSEGKTDLMKGFVSNRTKRKFDAHLTFDLESAKIGFDFPPRPAKKAAKKEG